VKLAVSVATGIPIVKRDYRCWLISLPRGYDGQVIFAFWAGFLNFHAPTDIKGYTEVTAIVG
jgi:hypothetical protein